MSNILHGQSPEIEHILNFFDLTCSDLVTKFSMEANRESLSYNYTRYTDKTCTNFISKSATVPLNCEAYSAILSVFGIEHDNFTNIAFTLNSPSDIVYLTTKKTLLTNKIKKQDSTLSALTKNN